MMRPSEISDPHDLTGPGAYVQDTVWSSKVCYVPSTVPAAPLYYLGGLDSIWSKVRCKN